MTSIASSKFLKDPFRTRPPTYNAPRNRVLDPRAIDASYPPSGPKNHIWFCQDTSLSFLPSPYSRRAICVSLVGGTREPDTPAARAAWGVYYGHNSRFNTAQLVPTHQGQTNQWAEIHALRRVTQEFKLRRRKMELGWVTAEAVVVVTDSDYVYQVLTERIWTWEGRFRPPKGTYEHALYYLHRAILSIEQIGVKFLFWKVESAPAELQEAGWLAFEALGQA
jgi:ribonuclease HI